MARNKLAVVLFCYIALLGFGQTTTAVQPYEPQQGEISTDTLNIHLDIPIVSKQGIGLPFKASLTFNNNFWTNVSGNWQPSAYPTGWGWLSFGDLTGNYNTIVVGTCGGVNKRQTTSYIDHKGTTHDLTPLNLIYSQSGPPSGCPPLTASGTLTDGSGISV